MTGFDDTSKLIDSAVRSPKKTIIVAIVWVVTAAFFIVIGTLFSETIKRIAFPSKEKQTVSDQITNIDSGGGDIIITVNRNDIVSMNQINETLLKETPQGKTYTEQELKNKVDQLYQQLYELMPEEAERRAELFVNTFAMRQEHLREKFTDAEKKRLELLISLPDRLSSTFRYVLEFIDKYISEIGKEITEISIRKVQDPEHFIAESNSQQIEVRIIHLPDSKFIKIEFHTGVIKGETIESYPSLHFSAYSGNNTLLNNEKCRLSLNRPKGQTIFGGTPGEIQYDFDGSLSEQTREQFQKKLDEFLDCVIASNYKGISDMKRYRTEPFAVGYGEGHAVPKRCISASGV